MTNDSELREDVRRRYAGAATAVTTSTGAACDCCHPGSTCAEEGHAFGPELYDALADERLPEAAVLASLGCGNPTAVAELGAGETVLDLGSGGGIDVVISNCVINLSTDKPRVFTEMYRVLRPGGRIGITDVVADNDLSPGQRAERGSYVGCIAGALSFAEYENGLRSAGFTDISITSTHETMPGIHSAIVKATKRSGTEAAAPAPPRARELPVVQTSCC